VGSDPIGRFGCGESYLLPVVLVPICGLVALLAIIFSVYLFKQWRDRTDIILPNPWFWEMNRIKEEEYLINDTEPPFWYKQVFLKSKSRELTLLNYLLAGLDFGDIKIANCWAIASTSLATAMSATFNVQKARFIAAPDKFCSEKWKSFPNQTHRHKTIDYFLDNAHKWSWNKENSISEGLILPVVHGTEASLAWKIAAGGFATLSTLDAGFYGKGIYFSTSALYTLPYFANKRSPAILICLTAPGNPYPVTESPNTLNSLVGKPLLSGYQSHYVVTMSSGFPLAEKHWEVEQKYDELVLNQEAQIVPLFLLEIDPRNLMSLVSEFLDKTPPKTKDRERSENRISDDDNRSETKTQVGERSTPALDNVSRQDNENRHIAPESEHSENDPVLDNKSRRPLDTQSRQQKS